MMKRSGGRMDVPQIFVDDLYFGDLAALKSYFTTNTKTE
jgi:glutaredoxin